MYVRETHTPYGCIITVSEAALRNNYRGWLLLLLLFPTNKPVHKQDGGVSGGSSHLCDDAVMWRHLPYLNTFSFILSSRSVWTKVRGHLNLALMSLLGVFHSKTMDINLFPLFQEAFPQYFGTWLQRFASI